MCIRDRWYQRRVRGPKKSGMETMTNSSLIEMAALDDVDAYDMVEFSEVEGDGCVLTDKLLLLVLSHWDPQTLSRSALVRTSSSGTHSPRCVGASEEFQTRTQRGVRRWKRWALQ
eukprot:TRINITY_DN1619_c0_g1_i3.p1 TRINITY_DN1619_c0_g1~~TRINITY_DN1619_c0_g1_i3.p1  ORF type:complete len:115 (-),score=17.36 TRINITY_DN1619_c0_g1_i3:738-1082(-)